MKKILAIALVAVMVLCLGVSAMAAGTYTVTLINGMDGSVHATYEVAAGEDFVFPISCAAPADMGPVAEGEEGAGVTTTGAGLTTTGVGVTTTGAGFATTTGRGTTASYTRLPTTPPTSPPTNALPR